MKKIISLILVFALLFTGALSVVALEVGKYSSTTLNAIEFTTSNVKIVGRTNPENPLLFGIHGSGVEFNVTGTTTVGVRIKSYNNKDVGTTLRERDLYFEINGQQVVIPGGEHSAVGTNDYIIATDLDPDTTYNVKALLDEESWGQFNYHGFYITHALVDDANATVSKAKDGDYKILVLGDSITSANNIGGVHLSYYQLMAKNFNADTQVLSACGGLFGKGYKLSDGSTENVWQIRIAKDWNSIAWENGDSKMPEMYDADSNGERDSYETDPDDVKFPANLVLINIGTNDYNHGYLSSSNSNIVYNQTLFKEQFYAMLDEMFGLGDYEDIGGYYSDATVVLSCNLMPVGSDIKDFYSKLVSDYLKDRPELTKNGNGNDRVTKFFYTSSKYGTVSSTDQHPNTASHAYAAGELTKFLSDYMGWEVKSDHVAYPDNSGTVTELPEAERLNNKLFIGFTDDNDSYVKKGGTIAWGSYIYPNYLPFELGGFVNPDGKEQGEEGDTVDTTAKYTNGFHVQGAQVRVVTDEEEVNEEKTGLRFIIVNNTTIKTELEKAITQNLEYERGFVIAAGTKFKGGLLEIGTEYATKYEAKKIFATTEKTGTDYDKYTACVIGIKEQYFDVQVIVRPYFKYTDNSGVEHVYYGDQYSCSLFDAASSAYGNEDEVVNKYLNDAIISKCTGDNDLNDLPF